MSEPLVFSNPIRGGIVLLDARTGRVLRVISLQFNPEQITRTLQPQVAQESGDQSDFFRIKGPAVETFKIDAELDIDDQRRYFMALPSDVGIHPEISALESLVQPTSAQLLGTNSLQASGAIEVAPVEAPLTLFVWSKNRVVPVRVTDFSVSEEAYDRVLNPIRAKVSIGMRVLSVTDVGFDTKAGSLFMAYLQQRESLAARATQGTLSELGLGGLP